MTDLRIFPDPDALARAAADELVREAGDAIEGRGRFTVALSGGSTPNKLYALLAQVPGFPWPSVHLFWGDERHVPPDHKDSNFRAAKEALLSKVPIPPENVHRIEGERANAQDAADAYERLLRAFFGDRPRFDLVLLGLGPDGHTASLFPGTDALGETRRLVAAPWVEKFGTHRITLTPPVLNDAAHVLFLVAGDEKAEALRKTLAGSPDVPAALIHPTDGTLAFFADRAAVRLIEEDRRAP